MAAQEGGQALGHGAGVGQLEQVSRPGHDLALAVREPGEQRLVGLAEPGPGADGAADRQGGLGKPAEIVGAAGPVLERGDLDREGRVGVADGPLEGARQGGLEDVAVAGVEGGRKPGVDRARGVALAEAA